MKIQILNESQPNQKLFFHFVKFFENLNDKFRTDQYSGNPSTNFNSISAEDFALEKDYIDLSNNDYSESGIFLTITDNSENITLKIAKILEDKFSGCIDGEVHSDFIQLKPENWFEIAKFLKEDPDTYFDSLQCNTGFDMGDGMLESRYNRHSMKHLHSIEIRIKVNIDNPDIPSVESIWRVADWFERETYDMYGIKYEGHRDLRRMLLPEDWEGFPLRKDYQEQETYHGIIVKKIKEEVWD